MDEGDELEKIRQRKLQELMKKMGGESKTAEGKVVISKPVIATRANFDQILEKNKYVVVDFWAEWCMPCRMIAPVVEELAREYAGKVVFVKLNTDENPQIAGRYGISAIPTLIFFRNGKPVDQVVGALPKSEIKRWIERNLGG